jgi:hypothetical protein
MPSFETKRQPDSVTTLPPSEKIKYHESSFFAASTSCLPTNHVRSGDISWPTLDTQPTLRQARQKQVHRWNAAYHGLRSLGEEGPTRSFCEGVGACLQAILDKTEHRKPYRLQAGSYNDVNMPVNNSFSARYPLPTPRVTPTERRQRGTWCRFALSVGPSASCPSGWATIDSLHPHAHEFQLNHDRAAGSSRQAGAAAQSL